MHSTEDAQPERLAIDRDMTIYHAEALKGELLGRLEQDSAIELDLSRIAEIDTSGIQLLMLAKNESMRRQKKLRIVAHSPAVQELIDLYNLSAFFGDPLVIPARDAARE